MTITAVLFDFDGTLADSEQGHRRVWNAILADYGITLDESLYKAELSGLPVPDTARRVIELFSPDVSVETLITRKTQETAAVFKETPVPLMPFARELLQACKAKGLKLALVTASSQAELKPSLEYHDLLKYFDTLVTRDDVTHSKPNPESYLLGLRRLGVEADQAFAVEDTSHGVDAAHAAQLRVLAVPNEYSQDHDFRHATAVVSGLNDVLAWMDAHRE